VRVTVVGCSPACPNPGGAQSGYLVEHEETRLLLDCGPGVLGKLREAGTWPVVDAIVISHLHLDHFGDVVPWSLGASTFAAGRPRPELWLPPGAIDQLREILRALGVGAFLDAAFEIRAYTEAPFSVGALDLAAIPVSHYDTPTFGLRVEADGRCLAYSADSAPCDALVAVATGADAFLCEATLDDDGESCTPRGHCSLPEALETHETAGSRLLVVTHRPVELAVPARPDIVVARDGLLFDV
jgi:ribonuclease BN (tRNA processing enzyme)